MRTSTGQLAVTVIGRDRPGIIADVAEVLAGLGANLEDSTMTLLRGHFAMVLVCTGPSGAPEVAAALGPLAADGSLLVAARAIEPDTADGAIGAPHVLSVHGADRLGIVAAVTRELAAVGGNITDLSTRLAGSLYVLVAEVDLPPECDVPALTGRLRATGADLGVEVALRPADPDVL